MLGMQYGTVNTMNSRKMLAVCSYVHADVGYGVSLRVATSPRSYTSI